MNSRDYIMSPGGDLSDRLIGDGRGGSLSGAGAWGADVHRIDGLAFDPGRHSHADYRTSDRNPHAEPEFPRLFHRSYEPEMPPPAGYERLTPPPPVLAPGPEPEPVMYQDSLMTQALFDWNMHHLSDAPRTPGEGWIGSSGDVIPARLAEIMIESSCLHSPPPDEPW